MVCHYTPSHQNSDVENSLKNSGSYEIIGCNYPLRDHQGKEATTGTLSLASQSPLRTRIFPMRRGGWLARLGYAMTGDPEMYTNCDYKTDSHMILFLAFLTA